MPRVSLRMCAYGISQAIKELWSDRCEGSSYVDVIFAKGPNTTTITSVKHMEIEEWTYRVRLDPAWPTFPPWLRGFQGRLILSAQHYAGQWYIVDITERQSDDHQTMTRKYYDGETLQSEPPIDVSGKAPFEIPTLDHLRESYEWRTMAQTLSTYNILSYLLKRDFVRGVLRMSTAKMDLPGAFPAGFFSCKGLKEASQLLFGAASPGVKWMQMALSCPRGVRSVAAMLENPHAISAFWRAVPEDTESIDFRLGVWMRPIFQWICARTSFEKAVRMCLIYAVDDIMSGIGRLIEAPRLCGPMRQACAGVSRRL